MIVSLETFNTYTGNFETSLEVDALKEYFLKSAQEIVENYLGYSPLEQTYIDEIVPCYKNKVLLPCRHVTLLSCIKRGNAELNPLNFRLHDHTLIGPSAMDNDVTTLVSFTAGWTAEEMPAVIVISILRIATLMLMESGGNIGLSGKTFSDNSRTFISYSNYKKYLQPLDGLVLRSF